MSRNAQNRNDASKSMLRINASGELMIYGAIGDWFEGNDALTLADEIDALEGPELNVRIHSPGGYILEGLVVYNRLKMSGKKVNVVIDGMAASMASVIAMAGDHIAMPKNAWLMVHKPMNLVIGNSDDMRKMADTLDGFEDDGSLTGHDPVVIEGRNDDPIALLRHLLRFLTPLIRGRTDQNQLRSGSPDRFRLDRIDRRRGDDGNWQIQSGSRFRKGPAMVATRIGDDHPGSGLFHEARKKMGRPPSLE